VWRTECHKWLQQWSCVASVWPFAKLFWPFVITFIIIVCRWHREDEQVGQLDVVELLVVEASWLQHPDQMTTCHIRSTSYPAVTSSSSLSFRICVVILTAANDSALNTTCWGTRRNTTVDSRWIASHLVDPRSMMTWPSAPAATSLWSLKYHICVVILTVANDSASNMTCWGTRQSTTVESRWSASHLVYKQSMMTWLDTSMNNRLHCGSWQIGCHVDVLACLTAYKPMFGSSLVLFKYTVTNWISLRKVGSCPWLRKCDRVCVFTLVHVWFLTGLIKLISALWLGSLKLVCVRNKFLECRKFTK